MTLEQLNDYGIDFEKGFERCMNDEEFYKEYLEMFLEDDCYARAKDAYEHQDYQKMFQSLHELKGVCSNAEMFELYEAVYALVELLRADDIQTDKIPEYFDKITAAYNKASEGISLIR
ncbi:MAG: Hpt domain-containing protein [bacterium]|nr:Hpt domain-containing protein [bacterium]